MYSNWFKASEIFNRDFLDKHSIGFQVQKDYDNSVSIGTKVVLLGYDQEIADAIRGDLYQCSFNFSNLQLIDLGNIRKTEVDFVVPILHEFKEAGLNIIVMGPDKKFKEAWLKSINEEQNVAFIEKSGRQLFEADTHQMILENEFINKIKLIGYQGHLIHSDNLENKIFSQSLSLGDFRNNIRDAEPVLRDVSSIHFMLDSIRYSELPGIEGTSPSGFTSEEACQLMRYFGLNPIMNCLAIHGYEPKYDFHDQGVKMVSQLIWYYLEGLDQKKSDKPDTKENMTQYLVELSDYHLSLSFWKSEFSGRWWVEIPDEMDSTQFLPCSYMDYKLACNNEMPKRIMKELE